MDYNKRAETVSEEEKDEMMMLVFPALYLASIRTRTRTSCYTSKLSGSEYTRELLEGHPHRSYHNLRMEPWIFKALADYLSSRGLLKSTRGGYCRRTTINVHVHAYAKCKFYYIV